MTRCCICHRLTWCMELADGRFVCCNAHCLGLVGLGRPPRQHPWLHRIRRPRARETERQKQAARVLMAVSSRRVA